MVRSNILIIQQLKVAQWCLGNTARSGSGLPDLERLPDSAICPDCSMNILCKSMIEKFRCGCCCCCCCCCCCVFFFFTCIKKYQFSGLPDLERLPDSAICPYCSMNILCKSMIEKFRCGCCCCCCCCFFFFFFNVDSSVKNPTYG